MGEVGCGDYVVVNGTAVDDQLGEGERRRTPRRSAS
jgi:hypothetical protein